MAPPPALKEIWDERLKRSSPSPALMVKPTALELLTPPASIVMVSAPASPKMVDAPAAPV